MGKLSILVVMLILIFLPCVSSSYIYGDIYVNAEGEARFYLESDLDPDIEGIDFDNNDLRGKTLELTRMDKGIWIFSLDLNFYDDILLDIHLPNSLKSIKAIEGIDRAIDVDNKIISLIDEDKDLVFSVYYNLSENSDYFWVYFLMIIILIALVIHFIFRFTKKKRRVRRAFPYLNENEEKIIKKLMKGDIRMKQLREQLKIPKASFTRYIINLEKKKLIIREGGGKNKVLRLK